MELYEWLGLAVFPWTRRVLLFRKRGAGVDAVKMKDHHSSLRSSLVSRNQGGRGFCLLASVLPAASEVRVLAGQAGLIRPSTGVSGVRSERLDAV